MKWQQEKQRSGKKKCFDLRVCTADGIQQLLMYLPGAL